MREAVGSNRFRVLLRVRVNRRRRVLVAGVERVIRASDKHFPPLDQTRGEEAEDRAKDHFLEECGLHFQ